MATPLAEFANARLLYSAPGTRGGPETGFKQQPGQRYLLVTFFKQAAVNKRALYADKVDLTIATDVLEGYLVGYCPLPDGADYKTYAYAADSNYNESGLRPAGLESPRKVEVSFGHRVAREAELIEVQGIFDDQGIGSIIRGVIGDRLVVKAEWIG